MALRAALLAAFLAAGLAAQDSPFSQKPRPGSDAKSAGAPRGLSHSENYSRALDHIKKNFAGRDWRTIPDLFCGLVFLLDGREDLHPCLERAVAIAKRKILDDKAFNGNWFVAYSALFLSIVYARERLPDVKEALEAGFQVALRTREDDTQGWGHNKGWGRSSGYYRRGGAVDLGIVTATMLSAALIARENGVEVPSSLIDGALKNLASISRNGIVAYGTNNRFAHGISLSSAAVPGLHAAKMTSNPIYSAVGQQLSSAGPNTERGHAYGPIHFFANALAAQVLGRYSEFGNHWIPILASRQDSTGAVAMQHDGGKRGTEKPELGATAVFALMVLMQKEKLLPPPGKAAAKPGSVSSPFSMRRPRIEEKELPGSEAPTGPVTGSGGE